MAAIPRAQIELPPVPFGTCPACSAELHTVTTVETIPGEVARDDEHGLLRLNVRLIGMRITHDCRPLGGASSEGPHSRACGIRAHAHGADCARDCPTCHGRRPT